MSDSSPSVGLCSEQTLCLFSDFPLDFTPSLTVNYQIEVLHLRNRSQNFRLMELCLNLTYADTFLQTPDMEPCFF